MQDIQAVYSAHGRDLAHCALPGILDRRGQPVVAALTQRLQRVRRVRRPVARWVVALLLSCGTIGASQAQSVTRYQEDGQLVRGQSMPSALGADLFGDRVDLFTGALEFVQTDVSLPGNSALPVAVGRRQTTGALSNRNSHFANWDLDIPHIKGVFPSASGWRMESTTAVGQGERCSRFRDELAPVRLADGQVYTPGFALAQLYVPGTGEQEVLERSAVNAAAPSVGGPHRLVTKSGWQIKCLPGMASGNKGFGEAFAALSPAGVTYRFDWMASKSAPSLVVGGGGGGAAAIKSTAGKSARTFDVSRTSAEFSSDLALSDGILQRSEVWLLPSVITDRLGNWVRFEYSAIHQMQLTRIESSDGRVLTLQYSGNLISSVSNGTRSWLYSYANIGGVLELASVRQPDGALWRFTGQSLKTPTFGSTGTNEMCGFLGSPGDLGNSTAPRSTTHTMYHPSGASGTFTLTERLHARSHVDCYSRLGPSLIWFTTMALTRKAIAGPGVPEMAWTHTYPPAQGGPLPCSNCPDRKAIVVTHPSGHQTRHVFGIRWHKNEGQLLQLDEGWNGSIALRTTTYRYRADTAGPYPAELGYTANSRGSGYMSARHWPMDSRTVVQAGHSFSWQATGFDAFARPVTVTRSSSLGYARGEQTDYFDHLPHWVLGQVARVTETSTGRVVESHSHDPASALRTASFSFGRQSDGYSYHPDGTLQTHTDAGGRATTYSNYKRGLAQLIQYPDATSESAVVDDLGLITRHTNAAGSIHDYAYDPMGRLARVTYPAGDATAYHPTTLAFEPVAYTEYGLPAGHWRQTVSTGNAITTHYFDALWRPRLALTWDAANPAGTRQAQQTRWDADGRKTFESHAQRDIATVDTAVPGSAWAHDALGRVLRQYQDSELGLLTTSTDYLSGFQRRVTNPRGAVTTTRFQAFDTPSEETISTISAPEGVTVNIARDVFGKPLAITRSGGGASATRSYVYDTHQRLCKTIEPETGATVQAYDGAGNLAWRASGLALPGTTSCDQASVPAARMISHGHGARNRLTSTAYGDGSPGIGRSYSADGLPYQVWSAGSTWTYGYNNRRKLTSEVLSYAGSNFAMGWGIDAHGQVAAMFYPDGASVAFAPNALGQPTQVSGYASAVTHHPNGAVAGYALANGVTHSVVQNARGLPQTWRDAGVVQDLYAYDANGNVTGITDQQEGVSSRSLGYDALDRLTVANGVWGAGSYAYDALDNLRASAVGARVLSHNIDAATNRLSSLTGSLSIGLAYDANGNLTQRGTQTFAFDISNRLQNATGKASYTYDGHGRRIRALYADGSWKLQVYGQGGKLLYGQHSAQGGTRHVYLGDKLIAETSSATGITTFSHTDALGSPVARTSSGGALLSRTRYEPYGATAAGTNPTGIGFTGHVNDADTGLVYMQQRYYEPLAGIFLSIDPVATDSDTGKHFNRFTYANNSPYGYIDPDGNEPKGALTHWPVPGHGKLNERISEKRQGDGRFGTPRITATGPSKHTGIDVAGPVGTPVVAAGDGQVITITPNPSGTYGNQVVIDHGAEIFTASAHLDTISTPPGTYVSAGQQIGTIGTTGNTPAGASPHLHFEVRVGSPKPVTRGGKVVDPLKKLPPPPPPTPRVNQ